MNGENNKNILAIDDSVPQLSIYNSYLKSLYKLSLVKSAPEALVLMDKIEFDLILLDIEMPNVSGFEFLHEIRKKSRYMTKPVIIISSHSEPELLEHVKNSSASGMLIKPLGSAEQLLKAIDEAFAAPIKNPFGL